MTFREFLDTLLLLPPKPAKATPVPPPKATAARTTTTPKRPSNTPRPPVVSGPFRTLTRSGRVKQELIDVPALKVLDLKHIDSTRMRIVGSAHWVSDTAREQFGATAYLLVREPNNRHDSTAVAVYGQGRKVGYVSAAKAAALTQILIDAPFDAFLVGGASTLGSSIRRVQRWWSSVHTSWSNGVLGQRARGLSSDINPQGAIARQSSWS